MSATTTSLVDALLSGEDAQALLDALASGMAAFTEKEAEAMLTWALNMRIGVGIVNLAIRGKVSLVVKDGEVKVFLRQNG